MTSLRSSPSATASANPSLLPPTSSNITRSMSRRRHRASPSSPPPETTARLPVRATTPRVGLTTQQQQALAVDFPASSPYVTAVGGTQMAPGHLRRRIELLLGSPAHGDFRQQRSRFSAMFPKSCGTRTLPLAACSHRAVVSAPSSPVPSWQNPACPAFPPAASARAGHRHAGLVASPGYLVCSEDPSLSGRYIRLPDGLVDSNSTYALNGGTSFGAPILAGFLAILNQYEHTTASATSIPFFTTSPRSPRATPPLFHDISSRHLRVPLRRRQLRRARPEQLRLHHRIRSRNRPRQHRLQKARGCMAHHSVEPHSHKRPFHPRLVRHPHRARPIRSPSPSEAPITRSGTTSPPPAHVALYLDGQLVNPTPRPHSVGQFQLRGQLHLPRNLHHGHPHHRRALPRRLRPPSLLRNVRASCRLARGQRQLLALRQQSHSLEQQQQFHCTHHHALRRLQRGTQLDRDLDRRHRRDHLLLSRRGAHHQRHNHRHPLLRCRLRVQFTIQPPRSFPGAALLHNIAAVHLTRPASQHAAVLALLLFALRPSRRKLLPLLSLLVLATIPFAISGCGSGGGSSGGGGGGSTGPQPQVYTVTLKATDSVNTAITASTSFTLTVNP